MYYRNIQKKQPMINAVNYEVKGQLAKLLATEELIIENRKVSTASFDVKRRVLTLPMWDRASGIVYDLLVGHEVGHALYTPEDDWKVEYPDVPKSFVNILEDVRIERLMKRKYPGLIKTFYGGYSQLSDQDFFGIADEDLDEFILADRINLYFKIGNFVDIPFSEKEIGFRDKAFKTETFEDVLLLAKDLSDYVNSEEKTHTPVQINGDEESDTPPPVPFDSSEDIEEDYGALEDESEGRGDRKPQEEEVEEVQDQFVEKGGDHNDTLTDKSLEENLKELSTPAKYDGDEPAYVEIPKLNMDTVIGKNSDIHEYLDSWYVEVDKRYKEAIEEKGYTTWNKDPFENVDSEYQKFRKSAQKEVNYLVKEFECRKAADSYARASTSKTGILDTTKLYTYKYNDDVFKKVTTLADGKNHGLIFILDWSGSMSPYLLDTVKQLFNLLWFCKKAQIPFEVYAFSNEWYRSHYDTEVEKYIVPPQHHERKENTLMVDDEFSLLNMFSSTTKGSEFEKQMKHFFRLTYSMDSNTRFNSYYQYPQRLSLSGTPLNEALVTLNQIIPEFSKRTGVQKVQCITLTDGEAHELKYNVMIAPRYEEGEPRLGCRSAINGKCFIRDRVSGGTHFVEPNYHSMTSTLINQLRGRFPYVNFIGIRVMAQRDANNFVRRYCNWNIEKVADIMQSWRKDKSLVLKDVGYHAYFGLSSNALNNESEFEVEDGATKARIKSAFKKSLSAKKMNKKVLGEFMSLIA